MDKIRSIGNRQGIETVRRLSQDEYQKEFLYNYKKIQENRKFRKKMEGIENELTWFNGKSTKTRQPEYAKFLEHVSKNYITGKGEMISARYRSITSYEFGKEPQILYFMILQAKKRNDLMEFEKTHDAEKVKTDRKLALEYVCIRNEARLLNRLIERLEKIVNAILNSMDERKVVDLDADLKGMEPAALRNRYFKAITRKEKVSAENIYDYMESRSLTNLEYLKALAQFNSEEYSAAAESAEKVAVDAPDYNAAAALLLESYALSGNTEKFIHFFDQAKPEQISVGYFIYLLQMLICNGPYEVISSDEFDNSIAELLKLKFEQKQEPAFVGMIYRNFARIVMEGIGLVEDVLYLEKTGEVPEEMNNRLEQLQIAMELYPADAADYIDPDYAREHGVAYCRDRIAKWILPVLTEKNPDKTFENINLAFLSLYRLGYINQFISNVEVNLENLVKFAANGQRSAFSLIELAYLEKSLKGIEDERMKAVLVTAKIPLGDPSKAPEILSEGSKAYYAAASAALDVVLAVDHEWKDSSMVSLMFYRVLENELNERIMKPMLASDLWEKEREKADIKWSTIVNYMVMIQKGKGFASGLTANTFRYLFMNEGSEYQADDETSAAVMEELKKVLNEKGLKALEEDELAELVGKSESTMYRDGSISSKRVKTSQTLECKKMVEESVEKLVSWVK